MPHVTDFTGGNALARLFQRRNIAVAQVHHVGNGGLGSSSSHFLRQRRILGQRLLA